MYYLRYNANFTNRLTWQVITKVEMDNTGLKVEKKFSLTGHCKVEFQFFSHFSEIDYVCFACFLDIIALFDGGWVSSRFVSEFRGTHWYPALYICPWSINYRGSQPHECILHLMFPCNQIPNPCNHHVIREFITTPVWEYRSGNQATQEQYIRQHYVSFLYISLMYRFYHFCR